METSNFGFDPLQFTPAPLQTEGWIHFTNPVENAFDVLADHKGMTAWVPLLKEVTVANPPTEQAGQGEVGKTRTMVFQGGITLVERILYWNAPLCYAYDTHGKVFPLQNYVGFMGVEPNPTDVGGIFIFREYFDVKGNIQEAVIPHGVVPPMKRAFHTLSKLIGGTDYEIKHVNAAQ